MTDPTAAGCTDPCIACMTDESHDPAPTTAPNPAAHAAVPSAPADQAVRRERYAAAIEREVDLGPTALILAREAAMAVADAEINEHRIHIAVYRKDSAAQYQIIGELEKENARLHAVVERVRRLHDNLDAETGLASPDDEITRGTAARKIAAALDGYTPPAAVAAVPSAPAARAAEGHRLALSQALGLGTGAPWDAIRDRAAVLREAAAEERLARVTEWVTSDVVTARNQFGNGYREAQRDIRDLLAGRHGADEAQQEADRA